MTRETASPTRVKWLTCRTPRFPLKLTNAVAQEDFFIGGANCIVATRWGNDETKEHWYTTKDCSNERGILCVKKEARFKRKSTVQQEITSLVLFHATLFYLFTLSPAPQLG